MSYTLDIIAIMVLSSSLVAAEPGDDSYRNLRRHPDAVTVVTETGTVDLAGGSADAWSGAGISVTTVAKDLTGRWGLQMNDEMTADGWAFADRSRTTAEIIIDHYRSIRAGAGDAVLIGCNTIGHLSAGIFEVTRTGDDTSGKEWDRVSQFRWFDTHPSLSKAPPKP